MYNITNRSVSLHFQVEQNYLSPVVVVVVVVIIITTIAQLIPWSMHKVSSICKSTYSPTIFYLTVQYIILHSSRRQTKNWKSFFNQRKLLMKVMSNFVQCCFNKKHNQIDRQKTISINWMLNQFTSINKNNFLKYPTTVLEHSVWTPLSRATLMSPNLWRLKNSYDRQE